jgi:hypothetical protein
MQKHIRFICQFGFVFICALLLSLPKQSYAQKGKPVPENKEDSMDEEEMEDDKLPEGFSHDDKIHYLELECEVTEPVKKYGATVTDPVPHALFRIYDEKGRLRKPIYTDEKGKGKLRLGFNHEYRVIISGKGFSKKILSINTHLPKDLNAAYIFPADVTLFRETPDLDASLFKEPVAIVVYSDKTGQFEYDEGYVNKMQPLIKKYTSDYLKKLK